MGAACVPTAGVPEAATVGVLGTLLVALAARAVDAPVYSIKVVRRLQADRNRSWKQTSRGGNKPFGG